MLFLSDFAEVLTCEAAFVGDEKGISSVSIQTPVVFQESENCHP